MKESADYIEFLKKEMNGTLTSEDRARLGALENAEAKADWEDEARLNALLRQLPNAPISSNFTSLTLQAVEREQRNPRNEAKSMVGLRGWNWAVRGAFALSLLVATGLSMQIYHVSQRQRVAQSVEAVSAGLSQPMLDILSHFDEIAKLPNGLTGGRTGAVGGLDTELLTASP